MDISLSLNYKRSFDNVIGTACEWLRESLKMLGCTPSIPSIGIGRTHYEATSLLLKSIAYGNLDKQSEVEKEITCKLNESGIGPMGFGGRTTVLGFKYWKSTRKRGQDSLNQAVMLC